MRYLSVCSGIEAASVAWHPLGWTPVAFSEIEPFPAAVLAHHYPDVPNYGDMTKHKEWPLGPGAIDLLVGGTPCQSFSVAGLRKGLSDPRGGLMLTYLEIAQRLRPKWILWENVPGVLSASRGRDFGSFLGALSELRYGWAYRVIDAQYCRVDGRWPKAVPQRRRRVFVVGCDLERDPRGRERAAEVLALGTGLRWHLEESGKARKATTADAEAGVGAGCVTSHEVAPCLETTSNDYSRADGFTMVGQPVGYRWQNDRDGLVEDGIAPACRASAGSSGFHEMNHPVVLARDNAAHAAVVATVDMQACKGNANVGDGSVSPTLCKPSGNDVHAVVVGTDLYNGAITGDVAATMGTPGSSVNASGPTVMAFKPGQSAEARSLGANVDVACTLEAGGGGNNKQAVAFQACGDRDNPSISVSDTAFCLPANAMSDRGQAVAFSPGNLARGAGASPNSEVAPTMKCSAGRGADDQRTCVAIGTDCYNGAVTGDVAATMGTPGSSVNASGPTVMAFDWQSGGDFRGLDPKDTAQLQRCQTPAVHQAMTVRRLTPRECERLQGFPDDWTMIPWRKKAAADCPDGPRYKALGNSMAVNCMAWIGERIAAVEACND